MCARVLVIDDDPVNLDLMIYLLNAFGHRPISADGGAHALETMRTTEVELVLCDIHMPGMDGFEFLRRLNDEGRHRVPVIGVTALAMVGDREKILAAGFDGYLAKPITPETFVDEVEKYLPAHLANVGQANVGRVLNPSAAEGGPSSTDELRARPTSRGYALVVDD